MNPFTQLFEAIRKWFESPTKEAEPPVVLPKEPEPVRNTSDPKLLMAVPDWKKQSAADLWRHEGYRRYAYPDPLSWLAKKYPAARYKWGFRPALDILREIGMLDKVSQGEPWTVGVGFTNGVTYMHEMAEVVARRRLEVEIDEHVEILDKLVKGWRKMPTYVQTVLVNLAFNLGYNRLKQFRPTLDAFERGEYSYAGDRLTRTLWYKQVGSRARELVERLKTGKIQDHYKVI
jgi:GH24 family phage-related lysozyme (muramidase)